MSKFIEYTLPEIAFIDANCHTGDPLDGRTVIQHIRTATILEAIDLSELAAHSFTQPTFKFEYLNRLGVFEQHVFVVHFSLMIEFGEPHDGAMQEVFEKCREWYCDYLAWEDSNILEV